MYYPKDAKNPAESNDTTIVVIDDDPVMRLSCERILAKSGFSIETFENGTQGLDGVKRLKPDLLLIDLKMPGINGMEVISRVHEADASTVIVVITGYATIGTAVEAMKAGAYDFLPKPFSADELRVIVNRGLQHRRLALEGRRLEVEREILKRRFVTLVSHQLKTPLAAVHQYLEVMGALGDNPEAKDKRQEWMDRCLKRTREMIDVINDWLTLSRVESGRLSEDTAIIDLQPILSAVLKHYGPMASMERVSLEAEFDASEYPVKGDRTCMSVLFGNLVENAIKYNRPGGKVTVGVKVVSGETQVSVTDNGIGIPKEYQRLLFDEFFRIGGQTHKTGTGLGLTICRQIATELGGRIEVESETDVGSCFRVHIPSTESPAVASPEMQNGKTEEENTDRG